LVLYVLQTNLPEYITKRRNFGETIKAVNSTVCPYVVGSVLLNVTKVGLFVQKLYLVVDTLNVDIQKYSKIY